MSLARATLGNLAATLLSSLFLLLTGVLTARLLGPEGKGFYVLALLVPHLAVNFLILGIGSANAYFVARGDRDVGTALGTSLTVTMPAALLVIAALTFIRVPGLPVASGGAFVAITAWSIPTTMAYAILRHTSRGMQRFGLYNFFTILESGSVLVFLAAGGAAGVRHVGQFCWLYVAASWFSAVIALALTMRVARAPLRFNAGYARAALHYGLRGHVGWLAELLNYRLDMLFVNGLAGPTALGIYSAAVSLAEGLWLLPNCLAAILMPRLASTREESGTTTAAVSRIAFPITVAGGLLLALIGGPILEILYGARFMPALQPLHLLLPGVILLSVVKVLGADFAARGRPGQVSLISWVSLGLTVVLDLTLIAPYGPSGAALASTAAYTASAILALVLYRRLTGVAPAALLIPRSADASAVTMALRRVMTSGAPDAGGPAASGKR